jgi:hypothetical protein
MKTENPDAFADYMPKSSSTEGAQLQDFVSPTPWVLP